MNISTKQDSRVKPMAFDQKKGGQMNKLLGEKGKVKSQPLPELGKVANLNLRKKPYPFQRLAIQNVIKGFGTHNRGQLIMPCGTGKTLMSLWIQEEMNAKRTLVLFPSLALLRQTKNEWKTNRLRPIPYICVCSEKDIDSAGDGLKIYAYDLDKNVATSSENIRTFLREDRSSVVFSTYQSLPHIVGALKDTNLIFDLVLCDEAHKTAGIGKSCFKLIHDDEAIPAAKRLYMTATPKIFGIRERGLKLSSLCSVANMNNPAIFGPQFHNLGFREAIDMGILVNFKLVVVGIEKEDIAEFIKNSYLVSEEVSIEEIVHNYAVQKFMDEWGARNVITFHSCVKKAELFQQRHKKLFPEMGSFHVNGSQTISERESILDQFSQIEGSIVSNAKCLTEGVDIPAVDTVVFCDPKNSHVDIVQALGRTLRRADHRGKECGYIVVPTLHAKDRDIDQEIEKSRFNNLLKIICALNNYDSTFITRLVEQSVEERRATESGTLLGKYQEKAIEIFSSNMNFSKYLFTQCLEMFPKLRMPYLEFKQWLKDNGINTQRKYNAAFRAGLLPINSPVDPVYAYPECKSWCHLFDKDPRIIEKRVSYGELKQWLKKYGINSKRKYHVAFRAGLLPPGSPFNPTEVYPECKGWWHLFGKEPGKSRITMPYLKLQSWLKKNGINSQRKYRTAYRAGLLPLGAPYHPETVYSEWQGWLHFFGKKPLRGLRMPYLEFKQWLKDNGINSQSKYYAAFKASLLPPHSPYDPTQAYLECRSWAELFDKKPRKYKKS